MTRQAVLNYLRPSDPATEQSLDLAESALRLASCDRPDVDLAPYRQHLEDLVARVIETTGQDEGLAARVAATRRVFADEFEYRGDEETYEDMRNANLLDVIDRRRGLPVALGILVIHAFRGAGGRAAGVNFPSHFVVRLEARGHRAIADPFDRLALMEAPDLRRRLKALAGDDVEILPQHWQELDDRDVLVRLQNNIKLRALAAGDAERALEVLETMTALTPERTEYWWETAVIRDRIGDVSSAIRALESYLDHAKPGPEAAKVEDLLNRLRDRGH